MVDCQNIAPKLLNSGGSLLIAHSSLSSHQFHLLILSLLGFKVTLFSRKEKWDLNIRYK